jgi:hypothetical protein
MDGVVVFIQRFGQHSSPTTTIKPDPIVHHFFHRSDETLHYIGTCQSNDMSDASLLKNKTFTPAWKARKSK